MIRNFSLILLLLFSILSALTPVKFDKHLSKRVLKTPEGNYWHYRNPGKELSAFINEKTDLLVISCFTKKIRNSVEFELDIDGTVKPVKLKSFKNKQNKTIMKTYYQRINPAKNHKISIKCDNENAYFRVFVEMEDK